MKILWICHFSNHKVRQKIHFYDSIIEMVFRFLWRRPKQKRADLAAWITNGIVEIENNKDIELHIVSPHYGMRYKTEEFELDRVHYHFFKPDDNFFLTRKLKGLQKKKKNEYRRNREIIKKITDKVDPDLIHMYGAENPYYSIAALDIDIKKHPFLVSLQTLMLDEEFRNKYPISLEVYNHRAGIERKILQNVKYIGSTIKKYRDIIWQNVNSNAIFTNTSLAVAENVKINKSKKIYDFVYFAADIAKSVDFAIDAFALACKKYPSLTLNIIGGCSNDFKQQLDNQISKLGIDGNIIFSGRLSTHQEVINQIQKSKFALLPLKIDIISGTIREAMFSGIPVVTTVTPGTPSLNENRESILISEQGDFEAMSNNMMKLIEMPELANKLKENGLVTVNERWNNAKSINKLFETYLAIINHHSNGKIIPADIGILNPKIENEQ